MHPHPIFLEVAPGVFCCFLYTNGGSLCRAFLVETVETGNKNRCVIELSHACLGKVNFRAFARCVGHLLKALITLEQVNTTELVGEKKRILISKTAMVGCCKLSLYANESCDEHAVYFRR